MVRVASELRDALVFMLQAAPPDNPAVRRLVDTYRDIARELGQQSDVEHMLRDLLPAPLISAGSRVTPVTSITPATPRRSARRITARQVSGAATSR